MKKIICLILVCIFVLSVFSGCKKETADTTTEQPVTQNTTDATSSATAANDLSLVAGVWKITSNVINGKSDDVSKFDGILTYLYNDGTLEVKNKKSKTYSGTYTFNGTTIITVINNVSSVMVVTEDYKNMVATKITDDKTINTTYTKISN